MKLGVIVGVICVSISLGLISLDKNFEITDYYFKGIILGFGIGLFMGNIHGYLRGKAYGKKLTLNKPELLAEDISILEKKEEI